jgi:hypothetical protein
MERTSYIQWNDDDDVRFVLDQHTSTQWFFIVLLQCTTVNVGETPANYMILYIA